jgi:hypothetical protein
VRVDRHQNGTRTVHKASRHLRSNAVAYLALFVALSGSSYAALKLPKNSVGPKQIKANAVNSSKVRNASLLARDFKAGQLPAGLPGVKGAPGATGPSDGYFSKDLSSTTHVAVGPGTYLVWAQCFKPGAAGTANLSCSYTVSQGSGSAATNTLGGDSYAPPGNDATALGMGTTTITDANGGTITATGTGSTTTAVMAVKVGSLHGP